MNDALRLYFGARSLLGHPSPYRPKTTAGKRPASAPASGPGAPSTINGTDAMPKATTPADVFSKVPGQATLHHHRYSCLPVDAGVPELDGDEAEACAAPPLDLDELAACAGQSRMFGPLVGRLIMGVGSYFALYATYTAATALYDERSQSDALAATRARVVARAPTKAMVALRALINREMAERARTHVANVLLLPGALGMSVNLLGSAELLGHFLPVLQPIAAAAMGPAAVCMALYGGYVAWAALTSIVASRGVRNRRDKALRPANIDADIWARMQRRDDRRERSKRRWDAGLAISGCLQAVGALAQWAIGPVWLLALLPGTVGLMAFKLLRVKRFGQATVTPQVPVQELDLPLSTVAMRHTLVKRRRKHLRGLGAQQNADGPAVRRALADAVAQVPGHFKKLVQALQNDAPSQAHEAEQLVRAMAALDVFAFFAREVARSRQLPRTRNAVEESGVRYTISGADIIALVTSAADADEQNKLLQQLRRTAVSVAATYGDAVALQQEVLLAELEGAMVDELPTSGS